MVTAKDMAVLAEKNVRSYKLQLESRIEGIENEMEVSAKRGERGTTTIIDVEMESDLVSYFRDNGFETETSGTCGRYLKLRW